MKYLNFFDKHTNREEYVAKTELEKSVYIQFCDDKKHIHFLDNQIEEKNILHNGNFFNQYTILQDLKSNYIDYYNIPASDINNTNLEIFDDYGILFDSNKAEYYVNYLYDINNIYLNDNVWNKIINFNNSNFTIYGNINTIIPILSLESSSTIIQNDLTQNNVSGLNVFDSNEGNYELESNIVVSLLGFKIPMRLMSISSGYNNIKRLQMNYGPNTILTQEQIENMLDINCPDLYAVYMSMNYTDYVIPENLRNLNNVTAGELVDYPLVYLVAHCNYPIVDGNDYYMSFSENYTNFRLLMPTNPFNHVPLKYKFESNNGGVIINEET